MRVMYTAHHIFFSITAVIFGEDYTLWTSS